MKVKSLSRVQLFATPWTVAYKAPPSMGFSRQGYWSGLPFPSERGQLNPKGRIIVHHQGWFPVTLRGGAGVLLGRLILSLLISKSHFPHLRLACVPVWPHTVFYVATLTMHSKKCEHFLLTGLNYMPTGLLPFKLLPGALTWDTWGDPLDLNFAKNHSLSSA